MLSVHSILAERTNRNLVRDRRWSPPSDHFDIAHTQGGKEAEAVPEETQVLGAREFSQWLRTAVVFTEDTGSIPSLHRVTPCPRESDVHF